MGKNLLKEIYAGYPIWNIKTGTLLDLEDRTLILPDENGSVVAHDGDKLVQGKLVQELSTPELEEAILSYYACTGGVELFKDPLWREQGLYRELAIAGWPQLRIIAHMAVVKKWAIELTSGMKYLDTISLAGLKEAETRKIYLAPRMKARADELYKLQELIYSADLAATLGEGCRPGYHRYVMTFQPSSPDTARLIAAKLWGAGYNLTDLKPETVPLHPNFWVEPIKFK